MHHHHPNRHQRRAEAAKGKADRTRAATIAKAVDYLTISAAADPTITGATLLLPDGETKYISAETAQRMQAKRAPQ